MSTRTLSFRPALVVLALAIIATLSFLVVSAATAVTPSPVTGPTFDSLEQMLAELGKYKGPFAR